MPPVLAVVIAFLVSVSIGFVAAQPLELPRPRAAGGPRLKVKFLAVQVSGFCSTRLYLGADRAAARPTWWPLVPAIFVTPLATFVLNRQLVFR